jgi:hypothetical protein
MLEPRYRSLICFFGSEARTLSWILDSRSTDNRHQLDLNWKHHL